MDAIRKPFQGVANILRFNWHFYAIAAAIMVPLAWVWQQHPGWLGTLAGVGFLLGLAATVISLLVSICIYDLSGLQALGWLDRYQIPADARLINIHSGFDETSGPLQRKFPAAILTVCDFYNPAQHTEISIQRARQAYPQYPGTLAVSTAALPLSDAEVDAAFLILAAHEIRDDDERAVFFKEVSRILKPHGKVFVVEHLRDLRNMLAYNLGAFHFFPRPTWLKCFRDAGLLVISEDSHTPFINIFVLQKHDSDIVT